MSETLMWTTPADIDNESKLLCISMNRVRGVATLESCCGHGKKPFRIWFYTRSWKALARIAYAADGCHSGFYGWNLVVITDCAMQPVKFLIESQDFGQVAYDGAAKIAEILNGD